MTAARVAVVGLGGMGRLHADNVAELGHELVAGVDVDGESRDAFADDYGVATYADVDELLAAERVDAVVVTTPNRFHEDAAVPALENGCNVLVEKPLAHDLASAERIADAAADSAGFCMVGFQNRFAPAGALARSQVEAGRFGDPTHVEAEFVRRRGIPGTGSWFTDPDLAGGGALVDVGVHLVDFVLYLLGFPEVVEVSGVTRSNFGAREDYADPEGFGDAWGGDGGFDVEDSASAFLRTADGTTVSLEVAWAANRGPSREVVLRGTDAGARMDLGGDELTVYEADDAGTDHYATTTLTTGQDRSAHLAQDEAFLDAVVAGDPPDMNTAAEGLAVQRVLDAVYRSDEAGRAVDLRSPPAE